MHQSYYGAALPPSDARIDQLIERLRNLEQIDDVGTIPALTSAA